MDLLTFIVILAVGAPIAQAIARRISRPSTAGDAALRDLLEQAERRLADTEQRLIETLERLDDMDERLDLTERMLAQYKARERLGP
ncbi:MAG: hypothetical protein JSW71_21940 [Gemmatimonadota bacterium]|nr:MAG: hypothetical protein JSW71_21940 [Gemmatimonadota bacterium]